MSDNFFLMRRVGNCRNQGTWEKITARLPDNFLQIIRGANEMPKLSMQSKSGLAVRYILFILRKPMSKYVTLTIPTLLDLSHINGIIL